MMTLQELYEYCKTNYNNTDLQIVLVHDSAQGTSYDYLRPYHIRLAENGLQLISTTSDY